MARSIKRLRLSVGLLLADLCLLVPIAIVTFLMNFFTPNAVGKYVGIASGVLLFLNVIVVVGAYWLLWLFYIALILQMTATLYFGEGLIGEIFHGNDGSLIAAVILFVGFFLCPFVTVLMLSAVGPREK